jgi:lantibiotic modifying enzyme
MLQTARELGREGAESVYRLLERTAEETPDGVRWPTLNYHNEVGYDASLYSGGAGIALFLVDYARLSGNTKALALARRGLEWCSVHTSQVGPTPDGTPSPASLYFGSAGLGLSYAHLARATCDDTARQVTSTLAGQVAARQPGPWTDLGRGAPGEGLFLLRAWQATGDPKHLAGATAHAGWLLDHVIRDGSGCHWLRVLETNNPRSRSRTSFSGGTAGTGYFFLALYEATREARWATVARDVADTLVRQAQPDPLSGLAWPFSIGEEGNLATCQWCIGSPGIGWFLAKAAAILEESRYVEAACAAGEATLAHGDVRQNPSHRHGLAGAAECFLELYRLTRDDVWIERALEFAHMIQRYRRQTPAGDVWHGDEAGYESLDYFCGAAGVGHFFLRLQQPGTLALPVS